MVPARGLLFCLLRSGSCLSVPLPAFLEWRGFFIFFFYSFPFFTNLQRTCSFWDGHVAGGCFWREGYLDVPFFMNNWVTPFYALRASIHCFGGDICCVFAVFTAPMASQLQLSYAAISHCLMSVNTCHVRRINKGHVVLSYLTGQQRGKSRVLRYL